MSALQDAGKVWACISFQALLPAVGQVELIATASQSGRAHIEVARIAAPAFSGGNHWR